MPDAHEDKVKSVHLINIPAKVTGLDDVEAGAQALGRLHKKPKHHQAVVRTVSKPVSVAAPRHHQPLDKDPNGFLSIMAYGIGRTISFISNLIK